MVRVAAAVGVVAIAALASVHALPTLRREANVIDGNVFVREHSLVLMSPPDTPTNADCLLGEWEPFGTCDAKTLTQLFVRKAQVVPQGNGAACEDVKATRPCKPVHCQMSEWSEWSDCVEGGYEIRTRKMIQAPLYGGRECPHDTDKVKCHPEDCVVCAWSDWTCDATSGKKTRTRRVARKAQLTGKPCPPLEQSRDCDPIDCVLDDGYEDEWTECDANGDKHRYRKIKVKPKYNGKECPKPEEVWDTQKQACPAVNCEEEDETTISFGVCQPGVDNKWFKTKVIGIKTYPKYGGTECRSVTERTKYETCEPEQCVMDEWQFEGECKENGKRKRTRKVKTQAKFGADECHDEEDEQPDPETCPPVNCEEEDESTTAFGECKQNDEDKKWYKTKTIGIKTQPKYGGKECRSEADRTITEACNPEQCAMSEWQFEGECKENGKRKRTRKVVSQGKNGADECHDEEDEQPDTEKCKPVDCEEFKSSEVPFGKCKLGKDKKWFKTKVLGIKKQPQYGGKPCQPENKRTFHTICHPVPCKMGDWKFEGTCDNDGKRKQVRKVEKQALYGAPTCRNEERRVVDATGCPPVDCVEFKESEVEFGPCEQKKGGQSFKTKVIGIKTEARNGGKACRPISERTIEVLCDRMS